MRSDDVDVGVVHVVPLEADPGVDHEAQREQVLSEARKLVGERGRSATMLRRLGDPASELINAAGEIEADLVVVGSRGRGAVFFSRSRSGSSAVAAAAPCPVLVVPPGGQLIGDAIIAAVDGSAVSGEVIGVARELSRLLRLLSCSHTASRPERSRAARPFRTGERSLLAFDNVADATGWTRHRLGGIGDIAPRRGGESDSRNAPPSSA